MNEVEKISNRIKELKEQNNNDIKKLYLVDEYQKLLKILRAVEMLITAGFEISDDSEGIFTENREEIFNEPTLDPVAILIENYDLLKGPLPDYIDRNELYNYINQEVSKKIKK